MREHLPSPLRRQNNYGALPAFRRLETNASGLPPSSRRVFGSWVKDPTPRGGGSCCPSPSGGSIEVDLAEAFPQKGFCL